VSCDSASTMFTWDTSAETLNLTFATLRENGTVPYWNLDGSTCCCLQLQVNPAASQRRAPTDFMCDNTI
jgi:hypothetical protein